MLDITMQRQIDAIFEEYDKPDSPGCALGVMQDGELVYSRGYGIANLEKHVPITADTIFHLASVSKQFTATCIALLEEAGEISLEDNVKKYISFLPDYGYEINLGQLVYMTNGLEDFYDVTSFIMGIPEGNYFSRQDAIRIIRAATWLKFTPGEEWAYGNTGYFLLACIIEAVTGGPFADFVREQVFSPLGMMNTFVRTDRFMEIPQRACGYAKLQNKKDSSSTGSSYQLQNEMIEFGGPGQAWSNVKDLALWEKNFYGNRLGGDESRLIEKMTQPGKLNDGTPIRYGYGQFISQRRGVKVVFHEGGAAGVNTVIYRIPEKRLSIICLANSSDFLTVLLKKLGEECYERVAGIVSPWDPGGTGLAEGVGEVSRVEKESPSSNKMSPQDLEALAGNYQDPVSSHIWEVRLEGSLLKVLENYASRFTLEIERPSKGSRVSFHSRGLELNGFFSRLDSGAFTEIQVRQGESVQTFQRYLDPSPGLEALREYEGLYTCRPLETTYRVFAAASGIRLENLNPQNDLLNVVFTPTLRDMFLARYPPLIGWYVIHFRRDLAGKVTEFSFRDEVPGREKWVFMREKAIK